MVITKRFILRLFLIVEVCGGVIFFIWGPHGMVAVSEKVKEHSLLIGQMEDLQKEVAVLKKQVDQYAHTDFYKEKIAREDLQMARTEEEVYIF
jgi:cell division protein FtsB